jgi:hypothetical protein
MDDQLPSTFDGGQDKDSQHTINSQGDHVVGQGNSSGLESTGIFGPPDDNFIFNQSYLGDNVGFFNNLDSFNNYNDVFVEQPASFAPLESLSTPPTQPYAGSTYHSPRYDEHTSPMGSTYHSFLYDGHNQPTGGMTSLGSSSMSDSQGAPIFGPGFHMASNQFGGGAGSVGGAKSLSARYVTTFIPLIGSFYKYLRAFKMP